MVADYDELDPFLASVARELKRPVHLDARFDERVMSALEPGILPLPTSRRTPQPWYRRPFSVTITPIRMMAAAAALVGVASMSLLRSGASAPLQVASAPVPASALQPVANVTATPSNEAVATQFIIVAPGAKSVALVGEFNDWDASRTPMQKVSDDGTWLVSVPLLPGRYEFQYEIDGDRRMTDPSRPQTSSEFGSPNSVVTVQGKE